MPNTAPDLMSIKCGKSMLINIKQADVCVSGRILNDESFDELKMALANDFLD